MPFALVSISTPPSLLSTLNRFGLFTHLEVCHAYNHFCHLTQTLSQKLAGVVLYLVSSICVATVQASSMQLKASYQIWICYSASCAITSKFSSRSFDRMKCKHWKTFQKWLVNFHLPT